MKVKEIAPGYYMVDRTEQERREFFTFSPEEIESTIKEIEVLNPVLAKILRERMDEVYKQRG